MIDCDGGPRAGLADAHAPRREKQLDRVLGEAAQRGHHHGPIVTDAVRISLRLPRSAHIAMGMPRVA